MPPVHPSNGGLSLSPLPGDVSVRSGQQMAYATRSGMFVSFLEFPAGSCLYVTAAVKGGSLLASRTWSQRPKFVQGSLEPVASLVPPPSPSLPFLSLLFWGFPEWKTQDHPFLSLVCPWTIVRSWEHLLFTFLSSPFLFLSLAFFLSSLHLPSSLGVPGCFSHSWEPFSSLCLVCPWTHVS